MQRRGCGRSQETRNALFPTNRCSLAGCNFLRVRVSGCLVDALSPQRQNPRLTDAHAVYVARLRRGRENKHCVIQKQANKIWTPRGPQKFETPIGKPAAAFRPKRYETEARPAYRNRRSRGPGEGIDFFFLTVTRDLWYSGGDLFFFAVTTPKIE